MMKKTKSQPTAMSDILSQLFKNHGWGDKLHQYDIWNEWENIVGKELAQKTQPKSLKEGSVLLVEVSQAAWLNELLMLKQMILKKIKEKCPQSHIKNIKFYC